VTPAIDPLNDPALSAAQGRKAVLATVVATWGSSPRPVGSHMVIDNTGHFSGSVSGGCIEGAVVHAALECLKTGKPALLKFGVSNEMAWDVGLACGGRIEVFVAPANAPKVELLQTLRRWRAEASTCALVTHLTSGDDALIDLHRQEGALVLSAPQMMEVRRRIAADQSGRIEGGLFVRVYAPPIRLVVVGAVHIAQMLAPMAALAGFDVTVIDPREAFVQSGALTGADVRVAWPDEGMAAVRPDARTAVVTLTHDPKLDDPALTAALGSPAFYIGALGSRKTHASRLARLKAAGFNEADLARIHGPVGLDINALTPAEIAVSIIAQVVAVLRAEAA